MILEFYSLFSMYLNSVKETYNVSTPILNFKKSMTNISNGLKILKHVNYNELQRRKN
jgi:hypothetical protein